MWTANARTNKGTCLILCYNLHLANLSEFHYAEWACIGSKWICSGVDHDLNAVHLDSAKYRMRTRHLIVWQKINIDLRAMIGGSHDILHVTLALEQ